MVKLLRAAWWVTVHVIVLSGLPSLSGVSAAEQPATYDGEGASWEELTVQAFSLYFMEAKYAEATEVTEEALRVAEQVFGPESLQVVESLENLGALYRLQGKEREGAVLLERGLTIRKQLGMEGMLQGMQNDKLSELDGGKAGHAERYRIPHVGQSEEEADVDLNSEDIR